MTTLIAGLVLFLGVHLIPAVPRLRGTLALRLGDKAYRGLFSLVAAVGLILIVWGYRIAPNDVALFEPVAAARAIAPLTVTIAIVLFAAANMRTHIRRTVRHPQMIGVILWSGPHLLANGDRAGTILFGSFLVWGAIELASAIRRHAVQRFVPTWTHDAIAIVSGLVLAWLTMRYHAAWFNTPPVA